MKIINNIWALEVLVFNTRFYKIFLILFYDWNFKLEFFYEFRSLIGSFYHSTSIVGFFVFNWVFTASYFDNLSPRYHHFSLKFRVYMKIFIFFKNIYNYCILHHCNSTIYFVRVRIIKTVIWRMISYSLVT